MHTPVFDDSGRLERVVVTRDSEWDDEQIALLLAARAVRGDVGPHGHPMSEAMSPLADPNRREGWRYVPKYEIDHAARALSDARAAFAKQYPDIDAAAYVWSLEKQYPNP